MAEQNINQFIQKYGIIQLSAYTALPCWYPFMARCLYTEANFIEKNFTKLFKGYFNLANGVTIHNLKISFNNHYKGIGPFAFGQLFYPVLDLSTTKMAKYLAGNNIPESKHIVSGAMIVGGLSPIIFNPIKTIVINQQNNPINNGLQAFRTILKERGLLGFY
ncbi:Hypothetical protein HVR_LOCUS886 [uncultured virus]|nr:Hypothetical protein HVR_LOCUS886 [uncultured virus]